MADPCNPFSYLNFLKVKERMIRFGVLENSYPLRTEYNEYCQWVAEQLPTLCFGHTCEEIRYTAPGNYYEVRVRNKDSKSHCFYSKHLVLGIGTVPQVPAFAARVQHPLILHSGDYLYKKPELLRQKNITVIGSGQSAAEIFYDLLHEADKWEQLYWFTRSERICPMDYSRFALELASPAYIAHFYNLPVATKESLLASQENLYKCVNIDTIAAIYEQLHLLEQMGTGSRITIQPGTVLQGMKNAPDGPLTMQLEHETTGKKWEQATDALILATGYKNEVPGFLSPVHDRIQWTPENGYCVQANYAIDSESTLFVQNADLFTHGFNSADLGMGPYRNAVILNSILGREQYRIEKGSLFQTFGRC